MQRHKDVVTITQGDLDRLEPDQLLNDNIIEFYLKYLHREVITRDKDKFHFFNTFFWAKLRSTAANGEKKQVLSWTRNVNLFDKKFIFVPVNDGYASLKPLVDLTYTSRFRCKVSLERCGRMQSWASCTYSN